MATLLQSYHRIITIMAVIAITTLVATFVLLVWEVAVRTIGFRTQLWANSAAEYALLYSALLGSPWLVRRRGHIFIQLLSSQLGPLGRRAVETLAACLCALTCLVIVYFSTSVAITEFQRGFIDRRAFNTPAWLVTLPMIFSFLLMSLEFVRLAISREGPFSREADRIEGL